MKNSQSLIVLMVSMICSIFLATIAHTLSLMHVISVNAAAAVGCLCAAFVVVVHCIVLVTYRRERTSSVSENGPFPLDTEISAADRKRRLSKVSFFAGILLIVLHSVLSGTAQMPALAGPVLYVPGSILLCIGVIGWVRLRKSGNGRFMDERTKKMAIYGFMYSWYVTFVVVVEMFWLEFSFNLSALWGFSPALYAAAAIVVMAVSVRLFQYFLYKKPDIEIW